MIKGKRLNVDRENKYKMIFRNGLIKGHVWFFTGRKYRTGHDLRCRWCTRSFWWCHEIEAWPRLCPSCYEFLRRLEFPTVLFVIGDDYPDEIPF